MTLTTTEGKAESQARLDAYLARHDTAAKQRTVDNLTLAADLVVGTHGGLYAAVLDDTEVAPDLADRVVEAIETLDAFRTAITNGSVYRPVADGGWTDTLPARLIRGRRTRTASVRRRLALVGAR